MPLPSFSGMTVADLKKRAVSAKDSGISTFNNTRDRYSSVPTARTSFDADYKKPPPPPPPARSHAPSGSIGSSSALAPPPPPPRTGSAGSASSSGPPPIRRDTRPDFGPAQAPAPPPSMPPRRPPVHAAPLAASYGPGADDAQLEPDRIDWANLSREDKAVFFEWLDEFFARYRGARAAAAPAVPPARGPPPIIARSRPSFS